MLKRFFPALAETISDWPPVKWMMAPLLLLFALLIAGIFVRNVADRIIHLIAG